MTTRVSIMWLKAASVVTILTGVICALASHSSAGGLWLYLFDVLKWPIDGDPAVGSRTSGEHRPERRVSCDVPSAARVSEQTIQREHPG